MCRDCANAKSVVTRSHGCCPSSRSRISAFRARLARPQSVYGVRSSSTPSDWPSHHMCPCVGVHWSCNSGSTAAMIHGLSTRRLAIRYRLEAIVCCCATSTWTSFARQPKVHARGRHWCNLWVVVISPSCIQYLIIHLPSILHTLLQNRDVTIEASMKHPNLLVEMGQEVVDPQTGTSLVNPGLQAPRALTNFAAPAAPMLVV
jgi:hypothetical protein